MAAASALQRCIIYIFDEHWLVGTSAIARKKKP